jgi:SAM-dependent methyltransferase
VDDVYQYNKKRWEALVQAEALFTKPWLDLDVESARKRLDRWGLLGDLAGKEVLCMAGGGGQQSAAFALLGARVTVLDIAHGQLAKDREAAAYYSVAVRTYQGDMRDLSVFHEDAFDVVWQPYSLNFVPDCSVVFRGVARVIRPGGMYHFVAANPFACGMGPRDWNGEGYVVRHPYVEGAQIRYQDEDWVFGDDPGAKEKINGPLEYRQTLGRIWNGLVENRFALIRLLEWAGHEQNLNAQPGEWEHFTSFLPPWLWFWTSYRPDVGPDPQA